jgi:hypothetical protein
MVIMMIRRMAADTQKHQAWVLKRSTNNIENAYYCLHPLFMFNTSSTFAVCFFLNCKEYS